MNGIYSSFIPFLITRCSSTSFFFGLFNFLIFCVTNNFFCRRIARLSFTKMVSMTIFFSFFHWTLNDIDIVRYFYHRCNTHRVWTLYERMLFFFLTLYRHKSYHIDENSQQEIYFHHRWCYSGFLQLIHIGNFDGQFFYFKNCNHRHAAYF